MLQALLLSAFLSAEPIALAREEVLRRELDGVAVRIAQLKGRAMDGEDVGTELGRLLIRAQELAVELERSQPGPAAAPYPSATALDLRARADALYLEADRAAGELAEVEARIAAALDAGARPSGGPGPRLSNAAVEGSADPRPPRISSAASAREPPPAIAPLLAERARLKVHVRALLEEAAELDDAADRLER